MLLAKVKGADAETFLEVAIYRKRLQNGYSSTVNMGSKLTLRALDSDIFS